MGEETAEKIGIEKEFEPWHNGQGSFLMRFVFLLDSGVLGFARVQFSC